MAQLLSQSFSSSLVQCILCLRKHVIIILAVHHHHLHALFTIFFFFTETLFLFFLFSPPPPSFLFFFFFFFFHQRLASWAASAVQYVRGLLSGASQRWEQVLQAQQQAVLTRWIQRQALDGQSAQLAASFAALCPDGLVLGAAATSRALEQLRHAAVGALAKVQSQQLVREQLQQDLAREKDQLAWLQTDAATAEDQHKQLQQELELWQVLDGALGVRPWRDLRSGQDRQSLRSSLLAAAIEDLNQVVTGLLQVLSDDGLQIHQLDSVIDPQSLALQPTFARLSSGQQRRVGLAMYFALFDLARRHSRYKANFVMLDEVFDTLDAGGQDAVRTLAQRLFLPGRDQPNTNHKVRKKKGGRRKEGRK